MAYIRADLVKETTFTTGNGNITTSGATIGSRPFSDACSVGDTFPYSLRGFNLLGIPTGDFEIGIGTYIGLNTIARTTVQVSSNGNRAVVLSGPQAQIEISLTAGEVISLSTQAGGWVAALAAAVSGFAASTGGSLIGAIQAGVGAVKTTLAEIFQRKVSVWDFMTDAQRADVLSGNTTLDHSDAFVRAVAALNGAGRVNAERKKTGVFAINATVPLGTSNAVDSKISIRFEPGTLVKTTLPNALDPVFSFKNVPGHFNTQCVSGARFVSMNGNGIAGKFNGQTGGGFDDCNFEGYQIGAMLSNAGTGIFNEFIRFNRCEFHLNGVGVQMDKDGGDQASVHGIAFNDCTMNIPSGGYGLNLVNVAWYNGNATLRMFAQDGHLAAIRMDCNSTSTGAYVRGVISCEGPPSGPAIVTGIGRFVLDGTINFMSGLTDNLASPNANEPGGLVTSNYFKPQAFGASGKTANELRGKAPQSMGAGNGPYGSLARLTATSSESIAAVCYAATDYLYSSYTQTSYGAATLGWGMRADGAELKSFAPNGTNVLFRAGANGSPYGDNVAMGIKDGRFLIGGNTALTTGSGSPNGVVTGSVGDQYENRTGGASTVLYVKESGSGNTGWVAK